MVKIASVVESLAIFKALQKRISNKRKNGHDLKRRRRARMKEPDFEEISKTILK